MSIIKKITQLGWLRWVLILVSLFSIYLNFDVKMRNQLRQHLSPSEREVLSVAIGPVLPEGPARVVKIKTVDGIQIEIYGPIKQDSSSEPLVDTIHIQSTHDSHMQFQGRATNLALKDMNGDKLYEIISPSYDQDLTPRLNIYTFNSSSKKFETYRE